MRTIKQIVGTGETSADLYPATRRAMEGPEIPHNEAGVPIHDDTVRPPKEVLQVEMKQFLENPSAVLARVRDGMTTEIVEDGEIRMVLPYLAPLDPTALTRRAPVALLKALRDRLEMRRDYGTKVWPKEIPIILDALARSAHPLRGDEK